MSLKNIADKVIETDVLVMGGGVAGCPAAAKAAEKGLSVVLVEKAKTERSGHAGAGIDTCMDFPRDNDTALKLVKDTINYTQMLNGKGRFSNPNLLYRLLKTAWWSEEEMEKLGVPMKWDNGDFHWIRHGETPTQMAVHWLDVKPQLAAAVKKRGVNVLDRTMVVDLLTNKGSVVGATAINTRTGEFIVIKARAVIVAAGPFARSYEPETPQFYKYKMVYHGAPGAISGDSWAAGYRAGAEIANMDIGNCWIHRIRDDKTMPIGTLGHGDVIGGKAFTAKTSMPFGMNTRLYAEIESRGLDPVYESIEHFNEDFQKRAEIAIAEERLISLKFSEDRKFNPHSHRYEVMVNKNHNFATTAGLVADENFKTTLNNLFVIGDACSGIAACGYAMMSGFLTAESMPKSITGAKEPVIDEGQIESQKQAALAPLSVKDGTMPMEFECCLRYINERYAGTFKSEGKLREGLRRLRSLRREFYPKLMAKNPHYLMRCLEARNIMDLTELHLLACLERKESRGNYIRSDYQESDPKRDNMVTYQRLDNGKPVMEIREVPDIKEDK